MGLAGGGVSGHLGVLEPCALLLQNSTVMIFQPLPPNLRECWVGNLSRATVVRRVCDTSGLSQPGRRPCCPVIVVVVVAVVVAAGVVGVVFARDVQFSPAMNDFSLSELVVLRSMGAYPLPVLVLAAVNLAVFCFVLLTTF